MYARNIDIVAEPVPTPPAYDARAFSMSTRPALWSVIDALPSRIPVGPVQKVYIELGRRRQASGGAIMYLDRVAMVSEPDFDFAGYALLSRTDQQRMVSDVIVASCTIVCRDVGADPAPFVAAGAIATSRQFPLPEMSMDEVLARLGLGRPSA